MGAARPLGRISVRGTGNPTHPVRTAAGEGGMGRSYRLRRLGQPRRQVGSV